MDLELRAARAQVPDSVAPRTATPDESGSVTPTAGEPAEQSVPDRYWGTTVDREVLFNPPRSLTD